MKLEVNNLSFKYLNSRVIFDQVNFELEKGQILSVLGPNGAGKSTLLNCIGNLMTPQKGIIRLNGEAVDKMPPKKVAQRIGYVPQIHIPTYEYTVREFVVMGRTPYLGKMRSPGDADYEQVERALDMVGIKHLIEKPYTQISGGERQLVTIARAIVQEPDFILLDEPTAQWIWHYHDNAQSRPGILYRWLCCPVRPAGKTALRSARGYPHRASSHTALSGKSLCVLFG